MDRRRFGRLSAFALAAVATGDAFASPPETDAKLETPLGTLRGATTSSGVRVFKGIPFAEPPLGALRFRPPEAPKRWAGVRDAVHFAPAAVQPGASSAAQSEDCLYLNVWTPPGSGPNPVFLWIHGGGFTGGRSSDPMFDGTSFAENGIVCITVAYRLGALGFVDVEPMLGSRYAGSANNALRDVIASLTWVRNNISTFGGDPSRVTIGGESAGAKCVDLLMGIPSASHLFQQMISESGGADRIFARDRALDVARGFASTWTARTHASASAISSAPAQEIVAAQQEFLRTWPMHFPIRPEVDGKLIPQWPLDMIRAGSAKHKRLLIGTNRDESALFTGPHPDHDPTAKDLGNISEADFKPIEDAYGQQFPALSPELRRLRSLSAEEYLIPSLRVAQAHVAGGGEAFVYRFDFSPTQGNYAHLAFHSYELRFVWDHLGQDADEVERQVAGNVHHAWCAFIKGEAPSAPALPAWPAYSLRDQPTMILDGDSHVENSPNSGDLAIWEGRLTH